MVGLDAVPLFSLSHPLMREGSLGMARYPLRHSVWSLDREDICRIARLQRMRSASVFV